VSPSNEVNLKGFDRFETRQLPLGELKVPPPGTVHLWFMDLRALGSPLVLEEDSLSEVLRPRHERTVRRFYLRLLLGAYLGISGKDVRISRMVKGKPVLDPNAHATSLDFSSASSHGSCLIGISESAQIGVDLEQAERRAGRPLALVRRYFSEAEKQRFDALSPEEVRRAFLHTWACKEAVVKAAGHGIANQLCRFTVSTDPDQPARVLDIEGDKPGDWQLAMLKPDPGFVGSIALRSPGLEIQGYRLVSRAATPGG
jgi:4'-phosphopantetheinyl transferase